MLLTIKELSQYLPDKPKTTTIYNWVCQRKVPYEKHGKKLFFNQQTIDEWNKNGRPDND